MKILKVFILIGWGVITLILLVLLLIQRHDAAITKNKLDVYEKKIAIDYIKILDEYGRNM